MSGVRAPTDRDRIRRLVDEYGSTQRHPCLPKFVVHGPFTFESVWQSDATNGAGCYVIYGKDGSMRYIGMSTRSVGSRIGTHFGPAAQRSLFWKQGSAAHFIDIIEVTNSWEGPSLEDCLVSKFTTMPESEVQRT
jgi:hypothetical protein